MSAMPPFTIFNCRSNKVLMPAPKHRFERDTVYAAFYSQSSSANVEMRNVSNNEQFAHEMGLGLRSLHRKLKAVSDQTPYAFINEFRINRAAELLAGSSHNINEIGFMVGIEDPSSFSRMFKNRFGVSPSDYRRTYSSSD